MNEYTYLAHYGIKGQQWGVRRFQFLNGALTALGKIHRGIADSFKKKTFDIDFKPTSYLNVSDEDFNDSLNYVSENINDICEACGATEPVEGSSVYYFLHPEEYYAKIDDMLEDAVKNEWIRPDEVSEIRKVRIAEFRDSAFTFAEDFKEWRKQNPKRIKKVIDESKRPSYIKKPTVPRSQATTVRPHIRNVNTEQPGLVGVSIKPHKNRIVHGNVYLAHYGIPGQQWHRRRFQNEDGSLTPAGRERYGVGEPRDKKYSKAAVYGMEAKYQAGVAAKKAKKYAKEAPAKAVSKAKKTANELRQYRREAKEAGRKQKAEIRAATEQRKAERAEAKRQADAEKRAATLQKMAEDEERRKRRREERAQKLIEKWQNKKSLSEIKSAMTEAKMRAIESKVRAMEDKKELAYMKARLAEEKKYAKRDEKAAKRIAKKDAQKRYTNRDIRYLSDEDIAKRTTRLKNEATLRKLEAERVVPDWAKSLMDAAVSGIAGSTKVAAGAAMIPILKELGLEKSDIDEYIRWTKKK